MRDERYDSDETRIAKTRIASSRLLALLKEHHDYTVPFQFVPKVIKIKVIEPEEAEPVSFCILPVDKPRITVDAVKHETARFFGLRHSEIISDRRIAKIVQARQVAMYLCKMLTTRSLSFIGHKFGDRDHTTVLHAVRKIERLIVTDTALAGKVASIEEIFAS